jgi:hypothetical protein
MRKIGKVHILGLHLIFAIDIDCICEWIGKFTVHYAVINLFPGNVPIREHSVSSEFLNQLARIKVDYLTYHRVYHNIQSI